MHPRRGSPIILEARFSGSGRLAALFLLVRALDFGFDPLPSSDFAPLAGQILAAFRGWTRIRTGIAAASGAEGAYGRGPYAALDRWCFAGFRVTRTSRLCRAPRPSTSRARRSRARLNRTATSSEPRRKLRQGFRGRSSTDRGYSLFESILLM